MRLTILLFQLLTIVSFDLLSQNVTLNPFDTKNTLPPANTSPLEYHLEGNQNISTANSIHIIDPSKVWYNNEYFWFDQWSNRYTFEQDSVLVGNYHYHRILSSVDSIGDNWIFTGKYGRDAGPRFYVLDSLLNVEVLTMDMSLEVGDMFALDMFNGHMGDSLEVISVDSILVLDGSLRRRIGVTCMSNPDVDYWIEGIGNIRFAFRTDYPCYVDRPGTEILCMYQGDIQIFQSGDLPCWSLVATDDLLEPSFTIYPNPGSHSFDVVIPEQAILPLSYELKSITGAKMLSGSHDNYGPMHVDTDALTSGVYVIEIRGSNGDTWLSKWICNKE